MMERSLTCYGCHRTLEPTSQVLDEDGQLHTYPGDIYSMLDGRPWCEGCNLHQRRDVRPVATFIQPPDDEDEPREIVGCGDWFRAYLETIHPYLPPGSHGGGGKSGRKKQRSGGNVEREEWTA